MEKTSDSSLEMDVPSHYCDPEERPADSQDCQIHCPLDCVYDEWTSWSTCHSVSSVWYLAKPTRIIFFLFRTIAWKEVFSEEIELC